MDNLNHIELIKYLLGEIPTVSHSNVYDPTRKQNTPQLTPLPKMYLREVNRFLFSGGIHFDIQDALTNDPRQLYINSLVTHWKLLPRLEKIWQAGATYGQIGFIIKPKNSLYNLEFVRSTEILEHTQDTLVIQKIKIKKNREFIYRQKVTTENYISYPLVPIEIASAFKWEQNETEYFHGYGKLPFVCINNTEELFENKGKPEFDYGALRLACFHAMTCMDLVENGHFFGSPLMSSPDPEDTIQRLKKRIQVLQKEPNEDGGGPEYLRIDPIKKEHLQLLEKLESNFRMHMGISAAYKELPTQISNVALKTLNSATIDVAQSKWLNYVDNGLLKVLELTLEMAIKDNILSLTLPTITCSRIKPYFAQSSQEKLQNATYAQTLIDMGVDRAIALQQEIYPYLTVEQVNEMLNPMLTEE